jgi:hypothetical protein
VDEVADLIASTNYRHFFLELNELFQNAVLTFELRKRGLGFTACRDLGLSLAVVTKSSRF